MTTMRTRLFLGIIFMVTMNSITIAGDTIDRTQRPAGKPAPQIHLPEIQKATLSNGLMVWLVEQHELPTVAFNLILRPDRFFDFLAR